MTPDAALDYFVLHPELSELTISVAPDGGYTMTMRRSEPTPSGDEGTTEPPTYGSIWEDPMTYAASGTMPSFGGSDG